MKIIFPVRVYQQLRAYVNNAKLEISGLGRVERRGEDFWIMEIKIFEQKVSGVETVLDRRSYGKFFDEVEKNGGNMGEWKLWWHSHNTMAAFFSKTDTDTIDDFDTEEGADNWFLSLVTNHDGDVKARVDIYQPIRCNIGDLSYDISFEDEELDEQVLKEIKEKVTEPTPISYRKPEKKDDKKDEDPLIPDIYDDEDYYNGMYGTGQGGDTKKDWVDYLKKAKGKKNRKGGHNDHRGSNRIHRLSDSDTITPSKKGEEKPILLLPEEEEKK